MNGFPKLLYGVYASTDYRERRELWYEVSNLVRQGIPTLVMGDFNCSDGPPRKKGERMFVDGVKARKFRNFIKGNELDLGFIRPRFTWCNNRHSGVRVWEQNDKAFAIADWIQMYPR